MSTQAASRRASGVTAPLAGRPALALFALAVAVRLAVALAVRTVGTDEAIMASYGSTWLRTGSYLGIQWPVVYPLASAGLGHAPSAFPARLAALRTARREPVPDAAPVARRADETLRALAGWLGALQAESFPPPKVETLIGAVNRPAPGVRTGRDFDAQRYLALVPLRQALTGPERDRPDLLNAVYGLRDRLNPPSPLTIGPGTAPDATQPRGPAPTAPLSSSQ